jgi:hypothetical protein
MFCIVTIACEKKKSENHCSLNVSVTKQALPGVTALKIFGDVVGV